MQPSCNSRIGYTSLLIRPQMGTIPDPRLIRPFVNLAAKHRSCNRVAIRSDIRPNGSNSPSDLHSFGYDQKTTRLRLRQFGGHRRAAACLPSLEATTTGMARFSRTGRGNRRFPVGRILGPNAASAKSPAVDAATGHAVEFKPARAAPAVPVPAALLSRAWSLACGGGYSPSPTCRFPVIVTSNWACPPTAACGTAGTWPRRRPSWRSSSTSIPNNCRGSQRRSRERCSPASWLPRT